MTRQSVPPQYRTKSSDSNLQGKLLIVAPDTAGLALAETLRQADLPVDEAESAASALQQCQHEQFELALIDQRLPEPGSLELAKQLRDQFELRCIIVASGGEIESLENAATAGVLGVLSPARDAERLVLAIRIGSARAAELRALRARESQLTTALNAEREINTAIGILMERMQLPRTEAFETLRRYARSQRQQMAQIAGKMLQSVNETNELLSLIAATGFGKPGPKHG